MSIVGTWNLTVSTPMGQQTSTLTLNDEGTGSTSSQLGSSDFSDVTIDGNSASFTVRIEAMGQEAVLRGTAAADGDAITGRYEGPLGTSEFTGERAA
jgi:hypothetical protein